MTAFTSDFYHEKMIRFKVRPEGSTRTNGMITPKTKFYVFKYIQLVWLSIVRIT